MTINPYTTIYENTVKHYAKVVFDDGLVLDLQGEADTDWEALAERYAVMEANPEPEVME